MLGPSLAMTLGNPTLNAGGGGSIVDRGVTYYRIQFGGTYLDGQIGSQPLYGKRAA